MHSDRMHSSAFATNSVRCHQIMNSFWGQSLLVLPQKRVSPYLAIVAWPYSRSDCRNRDFCAKLTIGDALGDLWGQVLTGRPPGPYSFRNDLIDVRLSISCQKLKSCFTNPLQTPGSERERASGALLPRDCCVLCIILGSGRKSCYRADRLTQTQEQAGIPPGTIAIGMAVFK